MTNLFSGGIVPALWALLFIICFFGDLPKGPPPAPAPVAAYGSPGPLPPEEDTDPAKADQLSFAFISDDAYFELASRGCEISRRAVTRQGVGE